MSTTAQEAKDLLISLKERQRQAVDNLRAIPLEALDRLMLYDKECQAVIRAYQQKQQKIDPEILPRMEEIMMLVRLMIDISRLSERIKNEIERRRKH